MLTLSNCSNQSGGYAPFYQYLLFGFTEYFLSFEATRPALLLALVTLVFSASVKSE